MPEDITLDEWQAEIERELRAEAENYTPRYRHWTRAEEAILAQFYNKVPILKLAEKLERTYNSVECKAGKMGLRNR
jgi:hypothetical protein